MQFQNQACILDNTEWYNFKVLFLKITENTIPISGNRET